MRKKEKNEDLTKMEKLIQKQIKQANQIQVKKVNNIKEKFSELINYLEKYNTFTLNISIIL